MADALKEHVEQCPKHPMSALKALAERRKKALVRTGKWSPTVGGYLVCMVCCNGVRCECKRGEHIPRERCPNCLGKSGSIFRAAIEEEVR